ncbi:hypothetical protein RUE5091_04352 [Ruegeria denitrificans]|uniref:Uncharacterized protein n=1 Tax=Ruegeria denitrificans TaxID=1715692 RepID=A0A0N7MAZ6_9RHOB|nr:hypothetical protein RUE5091_04352 [Ruegeria denitrificans]
MQQAKKTVHPQKTTQEGCAIWNTGFLLAKNPAKIFGEVLVIYSAASAYASIGGHVQTRFRSPYALSTRLTGDQYLSTPIDPGGKQACSRL